MNSLISDMNFGADTKQLAAVSGSIWTSQQVATKRRGKELSQYQRGFSNYRDWIHRIHVPRINS